MLHHVHESVLHFKTKQADFLRFSLFFPGFLLMAEEIVNVLNSDSGILEMNKAILSLEKVEAEFSNAEAIKEYKRARIVYNDVTF